ncbi:MAG: helix-turn-helix transcriptional regulator [Nocardioides sp.]
MSSRDRAAAASDGLGRRIRQARLAKDWTQGELAGTEFSVGYISRIESGERCPSHRTLTRLAARLGVTVEYLNTGADRDMRLARHSDVDQAELMLAGGDVQAAMAAAAALVDSCALKPFPDLERRARLVHALAYEATGDIHAAIMALEDLDEAFTDWEPDAEIGIALTRCYREVGEPAKAIVAGTRVLSALKSRGLDGATEAIRLSVTIAGAHADQGDLGQAIRIARRAIGAAEAVESPRALASAYWNASVYESEAGRLDRAVKLSTRALAILESGESTRTVARLRQQVALFMIVHSEGDLAEARGQLELASRELRWSSANPIDAAHNSYVWGRLHLREGSPEAALDCATRISPEVQNLDPLMATEMRVLEVMALVAAGRPYAEAFADAVALLTLMGTERGTAQLWFNLGETASSVGDVERTVSAYRSAAMGLGAAQVLSPTQDRKAFSMSLG